MNAKTAPVTPPQRTGTQKAKKFRHLSDVMFRNLQIQYLHLKEGPRGPFNSSL